MSAPTVGNLVRKHAETQAQLRALGVIRSANAPTGDYAELLVAIAYRGRPAPQSTKSWDVEVGSTKRIQVKARTVAATGKRRRGFSPFRDSPSGDLFCVFVTLDEGTLNIVEAHEVRRDALVLAPTPYIGASAGRLPVNVNWGELAATPVTTELTLAHQWLHKVTSQAELARFYPRDSQPEGRQHRARSG